MCREEQSVVDDEWVVEHLPLVRYVVARLMSSNGGPFDPEDLVAYGVVGLLQARRRYDPSRGNFGAFAIPRIRGAILDALRVNDFVPRAVRSDIRIVDEAERDASALTGHHLTLEETEDRTALPRQRVLQAWQASHLTFVPLEHSGAPNGDEPALAEVVDEAPLPLQVVEKQDLVEQVASLVEHLPYRERVVVSLHFVEGLTMREIGTVLSISESRVCQLQARALHRLRVSLEAA